MTCAETEILLHALLDDELDAGHARDVETHLKGCPRCAAQLSAYREMQQAMSAAQLRFTAPMSLRRRIEAALPALRAPPRAASRRSMLKGFAMGTALSAAIVATAGIKAALRDLFHRSHFRLRRMENDDVEQDHTAVRVRNRPLGYFVRFCRQLVCVANSATGGVHDQLLWERPVLVSL